MRVVVRREASTFDGLSLVFQGIGFCLVLAVFTPFVLGFYIVVELKAFFARQRIRKEQDMGL